MQETHTCAICVASIRLEQLVDPDHRCRLQEQRRRNEILGIARFLFIYPIQVEISVEGTREGTAEAQEEEREVTR